MLLPSDVARIVLGYLQEEGLTNTRKAFIQESPNLKEYAEHCTDDEVMPASVFSLFGKNLTTILNEYVAAKAKETHCEVPVMMSSLWKKLDFTLNQLKCLQNIPQISPSQRMRTRYGMANMRRQLAITQSSPVGVPCSLLPESRSVMASVQTSQSVLGNSKSANDSQQPKPSVSSVDLHNPVVCHRPSGPGAHYHVQEGRRSQSTIRDTSVQGQEPDHRLPPGPMSPGQRKRRRRSGSGSVTGSALETEPEEVVDKNFPQLVIENVREKILGDRSLQEKLAENINKILASDPSPQTAKASCSTVEQDQTLDEILGLQGEIHMSDDAIRDIFEQTESDPAFQALFDLFEYSKPRINVGEQKDGDVSISSEEVGAMGHSSTDRTPQSGDQGAPHEDIGTCTDTLQTGRVRSVLDPKTKKNRKSSARSPLKATVLGPSGRNSRLDNSRHKLLISQDKQPTASSPAVEDSVRGEKSPQFTSSHSAAPMNVEEPLNSAPAPFPSSLFDATIPQDVLVPVRKDGAQLSTALGGVNTLLSMSSAVESIPLAVCGTVTVPNVNKEQEEKEAHEGQQKINTQAESKAKSTTVTSSLPGSGHPITVGIPLPDEWNRSPTQTAHPPRGAPESGAKVQMQAVDPLLETSPKSASYTLSPAVPVTAQHIKATPVTVTTVKTTPVKARPLRTTPLKATPLKTTPITATAVNTIPVTTTTTSVNTTPVTTTTSVKTTPVTATSVKTTPFTATPGTLALLPSTPSKESVDPSKIVALQIIITDEDEEASPADVALNEAVSSISRDKIPTIFLSSPSKSPAKAPADMPVLPTASQDEITQVVTRPLASEISQVPTSEASLLEGSLQAQPSYIIQLPFDTTIPILPADTTHYIFLSDPSSTNSQAKPMLLPVGKPQGSSLPTGPHSLTTQPCLQSYPTGKMEANQKVSKTSEQQNTLKDTGPHHRRVLSFEPRQQTSLISKMAAPPAPGIPVSPSVKQNGNYEPKSFPRTKPAVLGGNKLTTIDTVKCTDVSSGSDSANPPEKSSSSPKEQEEKRKVRKSPRKQVLKSNELQSDCDVMDDLTQSESEPESEQGSVSDRVKLKRHDKCTESKDSHGSRLSHAKNKVDLRSRKEQKDTSRVEIPEKSPAKAQEGLPGKMTGGVDEMTLNKLNKGNKLEVGKQEQQQPPTSSLAPGELSLPHGMLQAPIIQKKGVKTPSKTCSLSKQTAVRLHDIHRLSLSIVPKKAVTGCVDVPLPPTLASGCVQEESSECPGTPVRQGQGCDKEGTPKHLVSPATPEVPTCSPASETGSENSINMAAHTLMILSRAPITRAETPVKNSEHLEEPVDSSPTTSKHIKKRKQPSALDSPSTKKEGKHFRSSSSKKKKKKEEKPMESVLEELDVDKFLSSLHYDE